MSMDTRWDCMADDIPDFSCYFCEFWHAQTHPVNPETLGICDACEIHTRAGGGCPEWMPREGGDE